MSPTPEELLTIPLEGRFVRAKELSLRLGISTPTLYDWMRTEGFPQKVQLGPNSIAWKGEEIKRWIDGLGGDDA